MGNEILTAAPVYGDSDNTLLLKIAKAAQSGGGGSVTYPITPDKGGTGVANNAASTLTISGNYGLTFTLSGATSLTFPTSGTVVVQNSAITATTLSVTGAGTNGLKVLPWTAVASYTAIYVNVATPDDFNYLFIVSNTGAVYLGATGSLETKVDGGTVTTLAAAGLSLVAGKTLKLGNAAASAGAPGTFAATTDKILEVSDTNGDVYQFSCKLKP